MPSPVFSGPPSALTYAGPARWRQRGKDYSCRARMPMPILDRFMSILARPSSGRGQPRARTPEPRKHGKSTERLSPALSGTLFPSDGERFRRTKLSRFEPPEPGRRSADILIGVGQLCKPRRQKCRRSAGWFMGRGERFHTNSRRPFQPKLRLRSSEALSPNSEIARPQKNT